MPQKCMVATPKPSTKPLSSTSLQRSAGRVRVCSTKPAASRLGSKDSALCSSAKLPEPQGVNACMPIKCMAHTPAPRLTVPAACDRRR